MSYYNAIVKAAAKQRSRVRAQERNIKRALFVQDTDLDALADFDETEVLEMREHNACSRERDIYNDERAQGIFGVSAANPNDYLR